MDGSTKTRAGLTNLDLDEETLNSITDKGLVYLPIPTMQAPSGTNTQKEFDLSNLDFNQTYYMTFRPLYSGIYQAGFGIKSSTETPIIDFYDGSVLGYTFGTWQNSKILVGTGTVRRAFPYYNLGKPFSVYGPEHGLQALLNINLGVFTVWPIEISFEDFYNSNLLGIKN